jgi:hypothetical protein
VRGQQLPPRRIGVRRPVRVHRRMRVIVHLGLRVLTDLVSPFLNPSPANDKHFFCAAWRAGGRAFRLAASGANDRLDEQ